MTESQPADYKSMSEYDSKYATRVMLILAGLVLIVMYIEGMLTPSLPTIAHDFSVTSAQVSLLLSAYLVGGVALTPVVGKLGDIYGKKRMLTIVLIIYAVAVSVTGFSPNFTFMVVSRTIQGIGLTIMPLGMSLAREEFPREIVPRAQAIISAMFGAGFAISLPLGSWVSNDFGWRMTYHTAIPFVVALALVTIIVIKESRFRRPNAKIDYYGAAMLGSALAAFVFALSEAPTWGWYSFNTIALFMVGVIILFPLTIYELGYSRRVGEAILNFKLLSERNVMVANVVLSISGMGMFLAMQALTYRFDLPEPSGFGKDILATGIALVPFALGMLVLAPITGSYVSRVGVKPFAILGAVLSAVGFLLEAISQSFTQMLVYEFITGAGLAMLNASLINLIVLTVNPKDMGLATAMNGTFRSVGSSVGAPVAGSIMTTITASYVVGSSINIMPAHMAYSYIFIIAAASFIVAALMTLLAREVLGKNKYAGKAEKAVVETEKAVPES